MFWYLEWRLPGSLLAALLAASLLRGPDTAVSAESFPLKARASSAVDVFEPAHGKPWAKARARGLLIAEVRPAERPSSLPRPTARLLTEVDVFGRLGVRTGLRRPPLYAVQLGPEGGIGWVPAEAVRITSGEVPELSGLVPPAPSRSEQPEPGPVQAARAGMPPGSDADAFLARSEHPWPAWMPPSVRAWEPAIRRAAAEQELDPLWVALVILVESGGWAEAVSQAGASGLMQLMPATARDLLATTSWSTAAPDPASPEGNIRLGARYLRWISDGIDERYAGDQRERLALIAAAYNAGPGRLKQHLEAGHALPAETRAYQAWILGMWSERDHGSSTTFDAWRRAGGDVLLRHATVSSQPAH